MYERVYLAPNNGAIGGGEVMLLRIADALRALDIDVTVVAPQPSPVLDAAREAGHTVIALEADGRVGWMRSLRRWDRSRPAGLLWCNGLVPSFATAGRRDRVVHLHQHPVGMHRMLALAARWRARRVLVPSHDMLSSAPSATVLWNWTEAFAATRRARMASDPVSVGFLGRLMPDKGIEVLAEAMSLLDASEPGRYRVVLGGEPLFVSDADAARVEAVLEPIDHLAERPGWVDRVEFFDTVDLMVVPSIWSEPFGLVAAEAMAARMPLIVSDAGALPEVVGAEGEVVPAGDATALADRIAAVSADGARNATDALYARWQREFSPDAGRERIAALMAALGVARQR